MLRRGPGQSSAGDEWRAALRSESGPVAVPLRTARPGARVAVPPPVLAGSSGRVSDGYRGPVGQARQGAGRTLGALPLADRGILRGRVLLVVRVSRADRDGFLHVVGFSALPLRLRCPLAARSVRAPAAGLVDPAFAFVGWP